MECQLGICAQSQTRILIGFGTGWLRVESQGLLFRSCKLGHFDFLMTQLSAPGSPRMVSIKYQSGVIEDINGHLIVIALTYTK